MLLPEEGFVAPVDRLIKAVRDEALPSTARTQVQIAVSCPRYRLTASASVALTRESLSAGARRRFRRLAAFEASDFASCIAASLLDVDPQPGVSRLPRAPGRRHPAVAGSARAVCTPTPLGRPEGTEPRR